MDKLTGAKLDLAVALLEGWELDPSRPPEEMQIRKKADWSANDPAVAYYSLSMDYYYALAGKSYSPSTIWNQGGPIIARVGIPVMKDSFGHFYVPVFQYGEIVCASHSSTDYLECAMNAYINKKDL